MPERRVLFIGDVVGESGRKAVTTTLPRLIERHAPDLVVTNGENIAGGLGITERTAQKLLDAGTDVITTGNHVYRHAEVYDYLNRSDRIVRPANYLESNPGRGYLVHEKNGVRWAVVNLSGRVFIDAAHSPFHVADRILKKLEGEADYVIVDFHAEATSEKVALGLVPGRARAGRARHPHPRTDRGRARAARRHRLHLGRRHDRPPRRRDRREAGTDHPAVPDADAGAIRDG